MNEPEDDFHYDWFDRKLHPYLPYMEGLGRFIKSTIASPNPINSNVSDDAQSDDHKLMKALLGIGVPILSLADKLQVLKKLGVMRGAGDEVTALGFAEVIKEVVADR